MQDVEYINVLGTRVTVLDIPSAVSMIEDWGGQDRCGRYVCVTGVHGVMEGVRSESIRGIHNRADAVAPDGMPLVWLGRLQGQRRMDRVYGPDLMLSVLARAAERGLSNFFYGGAPGVADTLKRRMEERHPGLRVVGTGAPPFRPLTQEEEKLAIETINQTAPDFLWIGLSTPKQEMLMAAWTGKVQAKVMIGVGAAFDFHSGRVRQAPRWVQRIGMEWFFRLCMEPRRLARRYLRNNPMFLGHVVLQITGLRRYPLTTPFSAAEDESIRRGRVR